MNRGLEPFSASFHRLSFAVMFGVLSLFLAGIALPWLDLLAGGRGPLSALAFLAGRPVCHQLADRSFCLAGVPLALCARCSGIVFGLWSGWLLAGVRRGPGTLFPASRFWVIAALVPLLADGLLNGSGLLHSPNWWRGLTGLLAGAALGIGLLPAWNQMLVMLRCHLVKFFSFEKSFSRYPATEERSRLPDT